jgi:hypothetical protein
MVGLVVDGKDDGKFGPSHGSPVQARMKEHGYFAMGLHVKLRPTSGPARHAGMNGKGIGGKKRKDRRDQFQNLS